MSNESIDKNTLKAMFKEMAKEVVEEIMKEKGLTPEKENTNNTLDPTIIAMTVINNMMEMQRSQMQWDTLFRLIYAMSAATTRRRRF